MKKIAQISVTFSEKLNFNDADNFQFDPQGHPYCYHGNVCSEISGLGNFHWNGYDCLGDCFCTFLSQLV